MEKDYRQAFVEVLQILKKTEKSILSKIPNTFIKFLEDNKDNKYIPNIDFTDKNWENNIKEETQDILALIYRDYIVLPEKRKKLVAQEIQEQIKEDEQLEEKYSYENLFKNKKSNLKNV